MATEFSKGYLGSDVAFNQVQDTRLFEEYEAQIVAFLSLLGCTVKRAAKDTRWSVDTRTDFPFSIHLAKAAGVEGFPSHFTAFTLHIRTYSPREKSQSYNISMENLLKFLQGEYIVSPHLGRMSDYSDAYK